VQAMQPNKDNNLILTAILTDVQMALRQLCSISFKTGMKENVTLLLARRLAAHMTHDVMFGGLAVPQTMHSSLSASRRLACGTFCG